MTIPEQAGKIAGDVVDALKSNPSCLVGLLFGIGMAVLTYLNLKDVQQQMHERQMTLIERCYPLNREKQ